MVYRFLILVASLCCIGEVLAQRVETNFKLAVEQRLFVNDPIHPEQVDQSSASLLFEPDLFWESKSGMHNIVAKPFLRVDEHDEERTHADVRELLWTYVGDTLEVKADIGKVFWGVTEFQHLVDVINQTDLVEDVDFEDKLGQPLLNVSLVRDWGIVDLYVLPYFRKRTFPGERGRLRTQLPIDSGAAEFESSVDEKHIDFAARWSHSFSDYDIGIHFFEGTNREPIIQLGDGVFIPFYEQISQVGIDLQATKGDWLWKLEAIHRGSELQQFMALQAGFEYTRVGVFSTSTDLGLLTEFSWDERSDQFLESDFQNDLFVGARLALNDAQSTQFLMGAGYDLDHHGTRFAIEGSRRLGSNWKATVDLRIFNDNDQTAPGFSFRKDDLLQIAVEYYF